MWYNTLLIKAVAKGAMMWYLYATHTLRAGEGQGTATDRWMSKYWEPVCISTERFAFYHTTVSELPHWYLGMPLQAIRVVVFQTADVGCRKRSSELQNCFLKKTKSTAEHWRQAKYTMQIRNKVHGWCVVEVRGEKREESQSVPAHVCSPDH